MEFLNSVKIQQFYMIGDPMDIKKTSQFDLYIFTLHILGIESLLIPQNSNKR